MKREIVGAFACPIYSITRDSELNSEEKKEINDIVEEGMKRNTSNSYTKNSYIFNTKLKNLKEFCEKQIKIYVENFISSKDTIDFYITQSWLNKTEPGESHHRHSHSNSIISGVFYVSTLENDWIDFHDPNQKIRDRIHIPPKENNIWNSTTLGIPVQNNDLLLFPSWLDHSVGVNKTSKNRVSISFNVFAKGSLGGEFALTELNLK